MKFRSLALLIVMFGAMAQLTNVRALDVSFTANDGVQIESDKELILIDAIYKHYTDWEGFSYDAMPEALIKQLRQSTKSINVLSTHVHRDHFHPELIGKLMDTHKNVSSYGSKQVVESIKEGFINEHRISERINCIGSAQCESEYLSKYGLKIKAIPLKHSHKPYEWIENTAFIIEKDNQTILHIGDAMLSTENIEAIKSKNQSVDLALLPYWVVMEPKTFDSFVQSIRPKKVALIHLPKVRIEQLKDYLINLSYKNIVVPQPGEEISL